MKSFLLILLFTSSLYFIGCNNRIKEYSIEKISYIHIDNIKETIDLKLSDLADSFELIQLETSPMCLLGDNTSFYYSEKNIIAISQDGIYQFSSNGHFVKKLINQGHGPQELEAVAGVIIYYVDEKTNKLYINDQYHPQRFIIYDLESERFLDPIEVGLPVFGPFAIYNDSLIICSYSGFTDSVHSAVLFYNFKGELEFDITHNKLAFNNRNNSKSYQKGIISYGDNTFYFQFLADDTLYQISNNRLVPSIILNFVNPRNDPPNFPPQIGDRTVVFECNATYFSIIRVSILEKVSIEGNFGDTESSSNRYFLNKNTGICSIISSYTDDLIGEKKEYFAGFFPNGKLVVPYYKYQIEEAIEKGYKSNTFPKNIVDQMYSINSSIKDMDNPVLLVGKLKKND